LVLEGAPIPAPTSRAALGKSASFYVVPYGGNRSAPRMLAALAGVIHDRQRADGHEHNRDEDND
jgi:hypothetical protein